jgi:hypothetical protein
MSRYAWLICEEAKQMIWLGKIISSGDASDVFFHIGDEIAPPNSQNQVLMKGIMKFLAQHIGKALRVIPEEELETITDESFIEIGNDPAMGILLSEYVKRFSG